MTDIGKNIRHFRENLGWSQEELARRMGYKSKSTINKVEQGVNDIPQKKIAEYAAVLGVAPAVLLGLTGDTENKKSDAMASVVVKMRNDPNFFKVVEKLARLDADKLQSVDQLLSAFLQ